MIDVRVNPRGRRAAVQRVGATGLARSAGFVEMRQRAWLGVVMRLRRRLALVGSVAIVIASTAVEAAPSALLRCDGYGGRRSTAEGLARATLILGTLGLFGSPEADEPGARQAGEKGIAACTEALDDERVRGNPVRRGEVLLMRGIRQFETEHYDSAWADAEAVMTADVPYLVRPAYNRTLGASALLLKAHIRVVQSRQEEAEALAAEAAARRPWGILVAGEAMRVMGQSPAISPAEQQLLDRLWRVSPSLATIAPREAAGDWAGAARDLDALIKGWPSGNELSSARLALDLALAGDTKAAETTLASVQDGIDLLATKATGTDAAAQSAAQTVARADELVQLAKAQLALMAGKLDDAKIILGGRARWLSPAPLVAAVVANAQAKLGRGGPGSLGLDPAKLVADGRAASRTDLVGKNKIAVMVLSWPRWEAPELQSDLGRDLSTPNKVVQDAARDGKVWSVQVNRFASFDMGAEAILVAAAGAARAKGKDRFAIVQRGEDKRLTREGLSVAATTVYLVFPGDAMWAAQAGRAISVAEVEAQLAPLFPVPPATGK